MLHHAAFVSTDDQEIVPFEFSVGGNGRGVATQFCALERIRFRILEFTCSPDDVLGHETPFIEVEMEQTVVLLDGVDVRVFQDGISKNVARLFRC